MGASGPQLPLVGQPRRIALPPERRNEELTEIQVSPLYDSDTDGLSGDQDEEASTGSSVSSEEVEEEPISGAFTTLDFGNHTYDPPQLGGGSESSFHRLLFEIAAEHQRALADMRVELERTAKVQDVSKEVKTPVDADGGVLALSGSTVREISHAFSTPFATPSSTVNRPRNLFATLGGSLTETRGPAKHRTSPMDFGFASSVSGTDRDDPGRPDSSSKVSWTRNRNFFKRVIGHQAFDLCCSLLIILNSALYGWAANSSVQAAVVGRTADDDWFRVVSACFLAWFVLEIALRMLASGAKSHLFGEAWGWNWFDLVVVAGDILLVVTELVAASIDGHSVSVVRMLRILRITRAVRVVRLVRFFRELRMMVFSILRSGSALLWSAVLLGTTIYIFAVYFIQITSLHYEEGATNTAVSQEEHDHYHEELQEMFGDLLRAEYTLYMAVSGGVNWGEVSHVLEHVDWKHAAVFCFFIFFTTLTMLNIITGIFVECAISSARSTQEEVAQDHMHATAELRQEMEKIFRDADADASGSVNIYEFEMCLKRREVRAYLQTLGIETDKAKELFKLLDVDKSGEITLEEFTFGCLRLKGGAKSIDLATLMNQTRRMDANWRRFFNWTELQFRWLHEFEERVERRLAILDTGEVG